MLEVEMTGRAAAEPRTEKYWHLDLSEPAAIRDLGEAVDAVDAALRESVRLHLRADVPIGVLLSSGLDSRMIASYAQELQGRRLQTFTVGFGNEDSEAQGAAETAREINAHHHPLELNAEDFLQSIERVAWHLDEPIGDPAAWAFLRVCELARDHVKVLLSGEGSDELFGGYDHRYLGMLSTIERTRRLRPLGRLLPRGSQFSPSRWERLRARSRHTAASEAVSLRIEGFPGDVRNPRGFNAAQLRTLDQRISTLSPIVYRPQRDLLSELLTLDTNWQLAESLLQKADKMSMAASIELRTPFVDREVAALAARIDSSLKLPVGGPGKLVLRHCLARRLNEPLTRPKRGFPLPLEAWFSGPLKEPVQRAILDQGAACLQYVDRPLLERAWQDFQRGAWRDGARVFYALWIYETWSRKFAT
jgi:asparagine synthase (glutamine-hydrolysing)